MIDRDPNNLKPATREKYLRLARAMTEMGHPIFLVEGYRTQERQDELYSNGITPAKHSRHTDREAFDVAFTGDRPYGSHHPWLMLGIMVELLGMTWGGRWESYDATHCEEGEVC